MHWSSSSQDVLLIVEVADSSLPVDRSVKLPLYAASRIAEYWIVDLTNNAIELYTEPRDGRYTCSRTMRGDETITPTAFPDVVVRIGDILPQPSE